MQLPSEFSISTNPTPQLFADIVDLVGGTEGWAFQYNDLNIWNSLDDHKPFVILRNNSEFVASISVAKQFLKNGEALYSVAFFYCVEKYRNLGFGRILFNSVRDTYRDSNVTLFGVGTMWKWYAESYDFKILQPYFHASSTILINNLVMRRVESKEFQVRNIDESDWPEIYNYDSKICEIDRRKMLKMWMTARGVYSKLIEQNNTIVGFGTVRIVSLNRLMISPLYSESAEIADCLIRSILDDIPDIDEFESIGAVYPYDNLEMDKILSMLSHGKFKKVEFCRSQFTQRRLQVDTKKVFAIRHCAHGYV